MLPVHQNSLLKKIELIAAYAVLLLCVVGALWSVGLLWELRFSGLWLDLWDALDFVKPAMGGDWDITALFAPYGGAHRIALPRLLFYLDAQYFALSNQLLFNTAMLLHSLLALLFVVLIARASTLSTVHKVVLFSIILLCFFSTTQWFNLLYPSDIQLFGTTFFSVMAIGFSIIYSKIRHVYFLIILMLLLILVAGFFQFLGLLAGFVIVVSLFWQKKTKSALIFLLFTLIILIVYLPDAEVRTGWQFSWKGLPFLLPHIMWYVLRYVASPLTREFLFPGVLLALASIVMLLTCSYYALRGAYKNDKAIQFFMLIMWFVIIVAAATSVGRVWQPNSATAERYQTFSLLYWVAFPALLCLLGSYFNGLYQRLIPWISLLLVLVVLVPSQWSSFQSIIWRLDKNKQSQMAYKSGFIDTPEVNGMLSHPHLASGDNPAKVYFEWLYQEQLGIFAKFYTAVDRTPRSSMASCQGELLTVEAIAGGYKVSGYGAMPSSNHEIFLVAGEKLGYGAFHFLPQYLVPWQAHPDRFPWKGYIKTDGSTLDKKQLEVFWGVGDDWCKVNT